VFSVSLDLGKLTVRLAKMVVWLDQTSFNRTRPGSIEAQRRHGLLRTLRWREMDSNHRFRVNLAM
jgi:hypothetical protein